MIVSMHFDDNRRTMLHYQVVSFFGTKHLGWFGTHSVICRSSFGMKDYIYGFRSKVPVPVPRRVRFFFFRTTPSSANFGRLFGKENKTKDQPAERYEGF